MDAESKKIEIIKKLAEQDSKRRKKIQKIFSNYDYINWLENFLKIYEGFSDDTWLNESEALSKEDNENVLNLPLFFEEVKAYATKNFIYPSHEHLQDYTFYNEFYLIRYNRCIYKISMICGQGTVFYCTRAENKNNSSTKIIDIKDVIGGNISPNAKYISKKLESFSIFVKEMIESEIPIPAIKERFKEICNNYEN